MKKFIQLTALLLCIVFLLAIAGCTGNSVSTEQTEALEPSAVDIYADAREALDNAQNITLDVIVTTYVTVNGEKFSERLVQTLSYQGLGTADLAVGMDGNVQYGIHFEDYEPEDAEEIHMTETFIDGMLFVETEDTYRFSSEIDKTAIAERYIPVVILDASIYDKVTQDGTKILFSEPTAAESWALPQEAEMTEAIGSVTLDDNSTITQMDYSLTYTYGPAQWRLEVSSKPQTDSKIVEAPGNADSYVPITDIGAVSMEKRAFGFLSQAMSASTTRIDNTVSYAAGFLENSNIQMNLYGYKEQTQAKIKTDVFAVYNGASQNYSQEDVFSNGRYTITANGGLPSTSAGVDWEMIRDQCTLYLVASYPPMVFWSDVTVTDLGSLYYLEFELNDIFGNSIQNGICETLWNDPSFLINLSSQYVCKTVSSYISIDKFTGMPVACGFLYEGVHTIDGQEYMLTQQHDQSIEAPASGAYQDITGQMLEEKEPENKATPLFYHVTGNEGQEMWLLGTIHVGDERTAYLPEKIRQAFEQSDALALECNTELFEQQIKEDTNLQEKLSQTYYYTDGTSLEKLLDAEQYSLAVKFIKATGNYQANMLLAKPYLWSNAIDQFYLRQGQTLCSEQGVEDRLIDWAEELDKPIWEVESSLFQLQMLTNFSTDIQLMLLKASMEISFQEEWKATVELYEKWCAGDEPTLREAISEDVDTTKLSAEELAEYEVYKPLIDEYEKIVGYDRNIGMLEAAIKYLESGDTVFFAVGLAHLLDEDNGIVDTLREAGYSVELVTY